MAARLLLASLVLSLVAVPCGRARAESVQALIDGKPGTYTFLDSTSRRWRLCAVIPQAKEHYFWDVVWGVVEQAGAAGVDIGIYQAGGFEPEHLEIQRRQVRFCMDNGADGVLIAAVDSAAFEKEEAELAARGRVVIDLTQDLDGSLVTSHSRHDLRETGRLAARYVLSISNGKPIRVAWFPGPRGPRWSAEFDGGLRDELASIPESLRPVLIEGGWAPTDRDSQATLVRHLAEREKVDVVLANAFAAVAAARYYGGKMPIVSLYTTDEVIEEMRKGRISAMVASNPAEQSRIAVDLAIRALEHRPYPHLVSLPLRLVRAAEVDDYVREMRSMLPTTRIPLPTLPPMND